MFPPNGLVEKVRFAHTTQHGAIAGKISAEIAKQKADTEYAKFRERTKYELSPVEIHFIDQFEAEQKRLKEKGNS